MTFQEASREESLDSFLIPAEGATCLSYSFHPIKYATVMIKGDQSWNQFRSIQVHLNMLHLNVPYVDTPREGLRQHSTL
jgi:hypothetical protein